MIASEVHSFILAFNFAFIIRDLLHAVLNRAVPNEAFADSKSVLYIISKDVRTTECRFKIYIHALKDSYEGGALGRIEWIPEFINPDGSLTKSNVKRISQLHTLMVKNHILLSPTV